MMKGKFFPFRLDLFSFLVFVVFVLCGWYAGSHFSLDATRLRQPLAAFPLFLSGLLFVILYVTVTFFLWFSKDVFRLAAALFFGPFVSTVLVWLAEMGNAWVLFHFSRTMGKEYIERSLPLNARRIYERSGGMGFGWLLLLRCAPVVAFRVLDMGAGLSAIPFGRYFLASVIGSPLRIFWLQLVLAGAGTAVFKGPAALNGYLSVHPGVVVFSMLYLFGMIAAAIFIKTRERTCR
jgi:uncharacterized membrane protein YdjX (TVP38/TMEM64 family)